jgi:hypothetical protein
MPPPSPKTQKKKKLLSACYFSNKKIRHLRQNIPVLFLLVAAVAKKKKTTGFSDHLKKLKKRARIVHEPFFGILQNGKKSHFAIFRQRVSSYWSPELARILKKKTLHLAHFSCGFVHPLDIFSQIWL